MRAVCAAGRCSTQGIGQGMGEVLTQPLMAIDRNDDPLIGDESKYVCWYSEITPDKPQAAIQRAKPSERQSP